MSSSNQAIKAIFEQALLAQAAYANLDPESEIEFITKLTNAEMSVSAATYVEERFEVLDHRSPILNVSGYSGTLFGRKVSETGSADFIFALRGTEPGDPRDWITDWIISAGSIFSEGQSDDM